MFENKNFEGIYYSRFIASWRNIGGEEGSNKFYFEDWLRSLTINGKRIPDNIIHDINEMRTCGKLELEMHAEAFITSERKNGRYTFED